MASISYLSRERRLVVEGPCRSGDGAELARAIEAAAEPTHGLVVDLTRAGDLPPEIAAAVTDACCSAERRGSWVRTWTLPSPRPQTSPPAPADLEVDVVS